MFAGLVFILIVHFSSLAAPEAKTLAVFQDDDAQQKRGELLQQVVQRRPPASGFHHRPSASFAAAVARLPSRRRRPLALHFSVPEPEPFHRFSLAVSQPLPVAARQTAPASDHPLFPGPRVSQAHQLPALQAHDRG